jgi:hypothetical protein
MKAFVVTVTVPDSWNGNNVAGSLNFGIQEWAKKTGLPYDAMECGVRVFDQLRLETPK